MLDLLRVSLMNRLRPAKGYNLPFYDQSLQRNNMGFLANKRTLMTDMTSACSNAYGVAQAMLREGPEPGLHDQSKKPPEGGLF